MKEAIKHIMNPEGTLLLSQSIWKPPYSKSIYSRCTTYIDHYLTIWSLGVDASVFPDMKQQSV